MQMRNRREALDGLARILDAGGLEELFAGSDDDALFLYDLLVDVSRGRSSGCYWEICRTARRRNITPEYVIDRAAVLVSAMEERKRADLYQILGAQPLASGEQLRQRWLDFAKVNHPDVGGDPMLFRQVKEAWEILRDPDRRSEYERFWVRALGPFMRVFPSEEPVVRLTGPAAAATGTDGAEAVSSDAPVASAQGASAPAPEAPAERPAAARPATPPHGGERRVVLVVKRPGAATPPPPVHEDGARGLKHAAARMFAAREVLDRKVQAPGGGGLGALVAQLEATLAPIRHDEILVLQQDVAAAIADLERVSGELARLLALKQTLGL